MNTDPHKCPCCGEAMVPAEAALNRGFVNFLAFGLGSSVLQIRPREGGKWTDYMSPSASAAASLCTSCGALLIAPSLKTHRKELGLES